MPVESAADRAVFVNLDEFGVAATYTLAAGEASTVNGVFSEGASDGVDRNASLASRVPAFFCRSADLPMTAAPGDRLTIGARAFRVLSILDPDATGMTALNLD